MYVCSMYIKTTSVDNRYEKYFKNRNVVCFVDWVVRTVV